MPGIFWDAGNFAVADFKFWGFCLVNVSVRMVGQLCLTEYYMGHSHELSSKN